MIGDLTDDLRRWSIIHPKEDFEVYKRFVHSLPIFIKRILLADLRVPLKCDTVFTIFSNFTLELSHHFTRLFKF